MFSAVEKRDGEATGIHVLQVNMLAVDRQYQRPRFRAAYLPARLLTTATSLAARENWWARADRIHFVVHDARVRYMLGRAGLTELESEPGRYFIRVDSFEQALRQLYTPQ